MYNDHELETVQPTEVAACTTLVLPKLCSVAQSCNLNYILDFFFQHKGLCLGTHMAHDDEITLPDVPFQKTVDVKCEIYEPPVHASTAATHTGVVHPLLPPSA